MSPFLGDKEKALVNGLNRINAPHTFAPLGSGTAKFKVWHNPETERFNRALDNEFYPPSLRHLKDANLLEMGF